jgi:hypothetical protein
MVAGVCMVPLGFAWINFVDRTPTNTPLFASKLSRKRLLRAYGAIFLWLVGAALIIDGFTIFFAGP